MKKRIVLWSVLLVAVLGFSLWAMRNTLAGYLVVKSVRETTGMNADYEKIRVRLLRPSVEILGLKLWDPADRPDEPTLEVKRLYVSYVAGSLFGKEVHFRQFEIDVPRFVVVQSAQDGNNLERLFERMKAKQKEKDQEADPETGGKDEPVPPSEEPEGEDGPPEPASDPKSKPALRIDELKVRFGKIEMRTYEEGVAEPSVRTYDLNTERTFKDVTDLDPVQQQIMVDVLVAAAPALLEDLGSLAEDLGKGSKEERREREKKAKKIGKDLLKMFQ